jgi:hypothetical protein
LYFIVRPTDFASNSTALTAGDDVGGCAGEVEGASNRSKAEARRVRAIMKELRGFRKEGSGTVPSAVRVKRPAFRTGLESA